MTEPISDDALAALRQLPATGKRGALPALIARLDAAEQERDDLRALVADLAAAPYTARALRGRQEGMADLTLRLPTATVRRLWDVARSLEEAGRE